MKDAELQSKGFACFDILESPRKESVYGVVIVLLVATFNVLAEQSSRSIVTEINAPFFMMYFSTGWLTGF